MVPAVRRNFIAGVLFVLAYQVVAALVILSQPEVGASYWYPPVGIGMVGFLYFGFPAAVLVFSCDFLVTQIQYGSGALVSLTIAATTTSECALFYVAHRMIGHDPPIADVPAFLKNFAAMLLATGCGAVIGSGLLVLQQGIGDKTIPDQIGTWWIGDLSGAAAVVPLALFAVPLGNDGWRRARAFLRREKLPLAGLFAGITLLVYLLFFDLRILFEPSQAGGGDEGVNLGLGFLLFIPILWIALRYAAAVVAVATFYVSTLVALANSLGTQRELVLSQLTQLEILNIQMMVLVTGAVGLCIAIGIGTRRQLRDAEVRALREARRSAAEREKAVLAHEKLAGQLRATMESIDDAFVTLDRAGNIIFLNEECARLTGMPAGTLVGCNLWEAFPSLTDGPFKANCDRAMAANHAVEFTYSGPVTERTYNVKAYPTQHGLMVLGRDITAQQGQKAQLQLLETAVAHLSEMVFITEATSITGPDPHIVYVNDAFVNRTGYSREELVGASATLLHGAETDWSVIRRIRAELSENRPSSGELVCYTKDGKPYTQELSIIPILDEQGRQTHFVSLSRDITERRMLEDQLRQSQKLEAIGKLTGGVAHDFNNLLTVIIGNLEILRDDLGDNAEYAKILGMIENAADRGADLTRYLLAFARRQRLAPKVIDVGGRIVAMEGILRRTVSEDIDLEVRAGPETPRILVDPTQLENAILNLVINARDAMPDGGVVRVEVSAVQVDKEFASAHEGMPPGPYVRVTVSDKGTGIAPEVIDHVFEPFFTTKDVGEGSGLGLSMVYGFVKQSGGHIALDTELGKGTSVALYFDAIQQVADALPAATRKADIPCGSETICVVEDDPAVRDTVCAQLLALGYRVVEASSGDDALRILRQEDGIDLLFTDVVMPGGMNGPQLADEARRMKPALPVLFSSGYADKALVQGSTWSGDKAILQKPYRFKDLATRVRTVLNEQAEPAE